MVKPVSPISIAELKGQAADTPLAAAVHAQLQSRVAKTTKNNKPYLEITFADSSGNFSLKIWSDSPVYQRADVMKTGEVVLLEGKWTQGAYGMEAKELGFLQPKERVLFRYVIVDKMLEE